MSVSDIFTYLKGIAEQPFSMFLDSDKRMFVPYLLSALVISLLVYIITKRSEGFFKYLFNKKVWMTPSTVVDGGFVFFNALVKVTIVSPLIVSSIYLAQDVEDFSYRFMGPSSFGLSKMSIIVFYTVTLTIMKDFTSYLMHLMMHKVPFLWAFHKVHHSATRLTPLTQYRIHPVELILNNLTSLFIFALVTGFFNYVANGDIKVYEVLGANVFLLGFHFLGSNLRHSHVKLKYPSFIESFFISPYQHQIHHSDNPKFFNKNMGSLLAVWDYLFGTLAKSKEIKHIRFGLGSKENKQMEGFFSNLLKPFRALFQKQRG